MDPNKSNNIQIIQVGRENIGLHGKDWINNIDLNKRFPNGIKM